VPFQALPCNAPFSTIYSVSRAPRQARGGRSSARDHILFRGAPSPSPSPSPSLFILNSSLLIRLAIHVSRLWFLCTSQVTTAHLRRPPPRRVRFQTPTPTPPSPPLSVELQSSATAFTMDTAHRADASQESPENHSSARPLHAGPTSGQQAPQRGESPLASQDEVTNLLLELRQHESSQPDTAAAHSTNEDGSSAAPASDAASRRSERSRSNELSDHEDEDVSGVRADVAEGVALLTAIGAATSPDPHEPEPAAVRTVSILPSASHTCSVPAAHDSALSHPSCTHTGERLRLGQTLTSAVPPFSRQSVSLPHGQSEKNHRVPPLYFPVPARRAASLTTSLAQTRSKVEERRL
jgi:hypothetical protein